MSIDNKTFMVKIVVVTGFAIALLPLLLLLALLGGLSSGTTVVFFEILAWPGRVGWGLIAFFLGAAFLYIIFLMMFSKNKEMTAFMAYQFLIAGFICLLAVVYILGAKAIK